MSNPSFRTKGVKDENNEHETMALNIPHVKKKQRRNVVLVILFPRQLIQLKKHFPRFKYLIVKNPAGRFIFAI